MRKTLFSFFLVLWIGTVAAAPVAMKSLPVKPENQVTLSNWTAQPYNHWSFRNGAIHSSVMVPRGGAIVSLPTAINADVAVMPVSYQGETATVRDVMKNDGTDGVIVLKDGKVVYEEYFGSFGAHDQHMWFSSTKSIVAQAMGLLVAQGKVAVNEKIAHYIPELIGTHLGQRSVREALNMVTAVDYTENYVNFKPGAVSTEYFRRLGLMPAYDLMALDPKKSDTPRGILDFVPLFEANPELDASHTFEYQSPNVDVIGWLIARVSGLPLNKFMAKNLWEKIGAEHDAIFGTDIEYTPIATGGFSSSLRDFAKVGLVMVNNGYYNGQQIFSEAWVKDTFKLSDEERLHTSRSVYKDKASEAYDPRLEGYKNFLWVHDSEKRIATFRGVFGQHLYINQERNLVIATFSSAKSASNILRMTNKPRLAAFDSIAESFE